MQELWYLCVTVHVVIQNLHALSLMRYRIHLKLSFKLIPILERYIKMWKVANLSILVQLSHILFFFSYYKNN